MRWVLTFALTTWMAGGCWRHEECHEDHEHGGPPALREGCVDPEVLGPEGSSVGGADSGTAPDVELVSAVDSAAADTGPTGCRTSADCASAGEGLTCDPASGTCVAPGRCTTSAACARDEVCIVGTCTPASAVCQFGFQCGGGRDCVDGRCLATCASTGPCPTGTTCQGGWCAPSVTPGTGCALARDCAAGHACIAGTCVAACSDTAACATGEACIAGYCQVDTRWHPFCTTDDQCAHGSVCRNGVCRAACPSGTDRECTRIDAAFSTCSPGNLCAATVELHPGCALPTDCAAGQHCINAACH